ncbi:hypothetical protein GJA_4630 [Janthinobacterium agaricidamnosum NBRC 102515 = DSM 9628]|uniref:Uncharacterized protein n=1 Tax=Janthinobacterium agaricidamnosum NBRC 102515 = DSM 9628 TaxID=1349767 RepID=W0VD58_9BURK|nr:hypothetical protein GJA_4630 [Janthinobacterium agaricidamnosum NBRC 102515 = DSM 9628]
MSNGHRLAAGAVAASHFSFLPFHMLETSSRKTSPSHIFQTFFKSIHWRIVARKNIYFHSEIW